MTADRLAQALAGLLAEPDRTPEQRPERYKAAREALDEYRSQSPAEGDEVARLRQALKFYADGDHFTRHQPEAWDTVSGEPANFFEDENNTATVEDGSVAKAALEGRELQDERGLPVDVQPKGMPTNALAGAVCSVAEARGFVAFGAGVYRIQETQEPGLVVTFRRDGEQHYGIGDLAPEVDTAPIPADDIIVRLQFNSAAGLDSLEHHLRSIRAQHWPETVQAPAPVDGDVVVTWDEGRTRILAVTRQDDEGRILQVIAQAPAVEDWPQVRRQDVEMAAALMVEASKLIDSLDPCTRDGLALLRWPLIDELDGAAGILRDYLGGESKPPVQHKEGE